ncbi:hypothetical protein ACS0TY_029185 [Phlomoides rotata]
MGSHLCGAMMMYYRDGWFVFYLGKDHASLLLGSSPHDQLLIRTLDSSSGLLLFVVGFLLFMVAFVKDREFHSFFAREVYPGEVFNGVSASGSTCDLMALLVFFFAL